MRKLGEGGGCGFVVRLMGVAVKGLEEEDEGGSGTKDLIGSLFLVLPYYTVDLSKVLRHGGLPVGFVKSVGRMLCKGVEFVHGRGFVHRDMKPSNILYDNRSRTIKIADFGLARTGGGGMLVDDGDAHDSLGSDRVVSLWYRPPEVLAQQKFQGGSNSRYSSKVDVWGVGCMIAECVKGTVVFRSEDEKDAVDVIGMRFGRMMRFEDDDKCKSARNMLVSAGVSARVLKEMGEDYKVFKGHLDECQNSDYDSLLFTNKVAELRGSYFEGGGGHNVFTQESGLSSLSSSGAKVVMNCLKYNPARRVTARQLLTSEWWEETPAAYEQHDMPMFDEKGHFKQEMGGKVEPDDVTYDV